LDEKLESSNVGRSSTYYTKFQNTQFQEKHRLSTLSKRTLFLPDPPSVSLLTLFIVSKLVGVMIVAEILIT
jgi:hypothetical protein